MKSLLRKFGIDPDQASNPIYFDSYRLVFDRMEQLQVRKISSEVERKVNQAFPITRIGEVIVHSSDLDDEVQRLQQKLKEANP